MIVPRHLPYRRVQAEPHEAEVTPLLASWYSLLEIDTMSLVLKEWH